VREREREREREKTVRVKESEWLGLVEQSNGLGNRHFWLCQDSVRLSEPLFA